MNGNGNSAQMKKTFCIACGVFRTDLEKLFFQLDPKPEIRYLEGGLHNNPPLLRKELQEAIDEVPEEFDRIILLYGTCGKGVVGLMAEHAELVIPRVHDCISLFLGGTSEYKKQFSHKPGTYYISAGWYEEQVQPQGKRPKIRFPKEFVDTTDQAQLIRRYGEDNAKGITDFFDSWKKNYSRAVYIDTGAGTPEKYAKYARDMADKLGWEYTRLEGSNSMIRRCFDPDPEADDILVVQPGRQIVFDPAASMIKSTAGDFDQDLFKEKILESQGEGNQDPESRYSRGLGIDAGGTYTDAVLYDFAKATVLKKAKALTTKWKYSKGIMEAVTSLPAEGLGKVDLVSLSTTLVTNAIVESNTHAVGLLVMPPGNMEIDEIDHTPTQVIRGRMNIEGRIMEEADEEEIRRIVRDMIKKYDVRAFAVSGYGASVNPDLELKVKNIIRDETAMDVCCGHELSGSLNFYIRARTAVLNAGTIPIMEEFLKEMRTALKEVGVKAPLLVVRGDGSIMTSAYASDFPVQTALSGPAASMAGARHLAEIKEALVADVGGTTTDIGFLTDNEVSVCDDGATIGSWKTHVRAVDMMTVGLGGDSEIMFHQREWQIGPRRITPFSWLNNNYHIGESLRQAADSFEKWSDSLYPMQWLCLSGKEPDFELTAQERIIMKELAAGPRLIGELSAVVTEGVWRLLKTKRLEKSYCLIRAGLTPTDLYHLEGVLTLWNSSHLGEYFNLIAQIVGMPEHLLLSHLKDLISRKAGIALLGRIFPENSPAEQENLLIGGNRWASLHVKLDVPVIGLGAPAALMLSEGVGKLGGSLVIPEHGDVANAVGAVTSRVSVSLTASITVTPQGLYRLGGIFNEFGDYKELDELEEQCLDLLKQQVLTRARAAGTSSKAVIIKVTNRTAEAVGGEIVFLERIYAASVKGIPDLV